MLFVNKGPLGFVKGSLPVAEAPSEVPAEGAEEITEPVGAANPEEIAVPDGWAKPDEAPVPEGWKNPEEVWAAVPEVVLVNIAPTDFVYGRCVSADTDEAAEVACDDAFNEWELFAPWMLKACQICLWSLLYGTYCSVSCLL